MVNSDLIVLFLWLRMIIYGAFHCHGGTPIAGWFLLGKMDDLGVASFIETPIWDCGGNILGIWESWGFPESFFS